MNIKAFIPTRGIGGYLAVAFSALSILLTVILVEVIGLSAAAQLKSNIGNGLAELALQTSDKLDRGMYERYREVQLMAQRKDLTSQETSIDDKRMVLDARQETYHYYAWIGLVDPQGKVMVSTRGMLEGADVSQRPWFRNALQGINVGDVHEAVLLAKLLPNPTSEPKRFVDVAFPYEDKSGRVQGVLGVHLSWQWAREVEQSVMEPIAARRKVESMIVSTDGTVLLGPANLQGKKLAQQSVRAAADGNGFAVEDWADGHSYLVGYSKGKGYGPYPGLGWTVLVRQDVNDAYEPVRRIQRTVLGSGIALALLFSVAGLIGARRISRPMQDLAAAAERIQRRESAEIPVEHGTYAEVRTLAGSLNALVSNLLQKESALKELNQTLEGRVEQRTRELEHALSQVRANEKRIQTIIESAQDAFIAVDLNGRITDWNAAAERMFGWRCDEAIGRTLVELVVPERFRGSFADAMRSFNETGQTGLLGRRLERIVVNRKGDELPVEVTIGLAGSGDTYFFSAFLHDISERKKVERMKNEFISTVSHELRTPMTSIRASLGMLAGGFAGELPPDTRELIDIAHVSCERLVRLVNDVLDIEKIESGNMEFDMRAQPLLPLVEQAVDAVRGSADQMSVRLEVDCAPGDVLVNADHDRMIQVLVNLLSNAIKFSPSGSAVTVRVECEGGKVRMSVIDRGPGIPAEFRERIFQKFAQADSTDSRQKGGTGLGLSICKSIVEEHGGRIGFESDAGSGTMFVVELPGV
ncbi:sensor histidine kinase [Noviherbaspirillum denitrificans]|uniref:histidine kinase n=1 Tax=Noviherbaspirillum denitrificans TaxID=1968433 RepID=A0A254TMR1_9BURK|nr:sensor histidine kinase [Noviherbaspirillum denitrificans]OWW20998.1 PAS domain-containing sensor histidine kinase [Noviherbaspirillum denitrificans]